MRSAVVNRVRRNTRRNAVIYGIYTDSYQWTFLNYDNNGVVCDPLYLFNPL